MTDKAKSDAEKENLTNTNAHYLVLMQEYKERIAELEQRVESCKVFAKDRIRYKCALVFYAYEDTFLAPPEFEDRIVEDGKVVMVPYGTNARNALEWKEEEPLEKGGK